MNLNQTILGLDRVAEETRSVRQLESIRHTAENLGAFTSWREIEIAGGDA